MPFDRKKLDDFYPPTWDGTYVGDYSTNADPVTALRAMLGQDVFNYFTAQRTDGDLFNRDLALGNAIQMILDYLGTRTGMLFNQKNTRMLAGDWVTIGRLQADLTATPKVPDWYVVASSIYKKTGVGTGDCVLRIRNMDTNAIVLEHTHNDQDFPIEWPTPASPGNRDLVLEGDVNWEFQIYNETSAVATVMAWVVVQPKQGALPSAIFSSSSSESSDSSSSTSSVSSSSFSSVNSSSSSDSSVSSSSTSSVNSSSSSSSISSSSSLSSESTSSDSSVSSISSSSTSSISSSSTSSVNSSSSSSSTSSLSSGLSTSSASSLNSSSSSSSTSSVNSSSSTSSVSSISSSSVSSSSSDSSSSQSSSSFSSDSSSSPSTSSASSKSSSSDSSISSSSSSSP